MGRRSAENVRADKHTRTRRRDLERAHVNVGASNWYKTTTRSRDESVTWKEFTEFFSNITFFTLSDWRSSITEELLDREAIRP